MFDCIGNTADEIAQKLIALKLRGARHAVRFLNPLVRYCLAQLPHIMDANVMTGETLQIVHLDGKSVEIALPRAAMDFLVAFDGGEYPELEMPR